MTGYIRKILESSLIDGPGHRAVVFFQGCDFRCLWCHNPETIAVCRGCETCPRSCAEKPDAVTLYEPSLLVSRLMPLVPFIDGVTFSGGECTLQPDFVIAAALSFKEASGLTVLVDTNGNADPAAFAEIAKAVDGFMIDVKAYGDKLHRQLTGAGNERVLENARTAAAAGKLAELRTVCAQGFVDNEKEVTRIASFAASLGAPLKIIPFRPNGVTGPLSSLPPFPRPRYETLLAAARSVPDTIILEVKA